MLPVSFFEPHVSDVQLCPGTTECLRRIIDACGFFRPRAHMRMKALFFVSLAVIVLRVSAQSSNVTTCVPLYEWAINTLNQSPCLVAAYVENVCESAFVEVNAIPPDTHYAGPSKQDATLCRCSTVAYSLISACGGCQNRTYISWTAWATNCPKIQVAKFLESIPSEVVVPPWAYLDVTLSNNFFNPGLAMANASAVLTSPAAPSSTTTTTTTSSSQLAVPPSTSNGVSLPSYTPSVATKKINAGAIAGGVVGGLAVLVVAGLLVLFCFRRNKQHTNPYPPNTASSFSATSQPQFHGSSIVPSISPFPYHQQQPFPKDTSDTETYPGSPVTSVGHTTFDTTNVTPAVQIVRRYTGAAEV
ncbi:hypothetical protein C8F01DRAFT_79160 [Mycena amicta]|nr:hypothetical protein C8F01DRAFT_79160 [Mycena amicta]